MQTAYFTTTQANALESAKYQLEGIGGNVKYFLKS
jgi:hypothetical protein